jgi:hypothetical protein
MDYDRNNCSSLILSCVLLVLQRMNFPYEIMELVLTKAFVELYASHCVRLMPRADVISLTSVSSVCAEWCTDHHFVCLKATV